MADYLLGMDYGTGGAKACIIDLEGQVLGFTFEEYPFIHEKPGWSEHDPVSYWEIACRLIQGALDQAGVDPGEIRGIAVSSALPSLVMVDVDHNPIHRAYNLMDRRATREVAWLEESIGEEGLVPGIPVAAGQVDCNAGYLGAGSTEEGDIQCNLGSVGNFGLVFKDAEFSFSPIGHLMINFPYTVDSRNTYITVPTTMTGGQSIRYLRDQFGQYEVEVERVLGVSSYDLLNMEAQKVPLGSEGLIILPFLMGERTPIWDVYARGVIFGLSLNHTKGHVVRAMMEAVAYAMYDSFRLIQEAGLKVNLPLVMNEGGAVSVLWRQIITDVFDVPIVLAKRRTGAPFGDAILAGVATGVFDGFRIAKEWAEYVEPMEPNPENHERYMGYFGVYKQIYEHVKGDFRALAELRDQS